MKRLLPLLLALLLLTGCGSPQLEDRVLVVSMGIDETEDGGIGLTIQIPASSQGGGDEGGEDPGNQNGYQIISVKGTDWYDAMTLMYASVPHMLHFGQVREIVIAESLARTDRLKTLLESLYSDHHIRANARIVVARGEALAYLNKQKPDIGQRLSKYLDTTLQALVTKGYIPNALFGETARDMGRAGWDPVLILASLHQGEDSGGAGNPVDLMAGDLPKEGGSKLELAGGAATDGEKVVGLLTGYDIQLLNLLSGKTKHLVLKADGHYADLHLGKPAKLGVATGERDTLTVSVFVDSFTKADEESRPDAVRDALKADLEELIARLQAMGSDAAGFGAKVKTGFATKAQWDEYRWKDRYRQALIQVEVEVRAMKLAS